LYRNGLWVLTCGHAPYTGLKSRPTNHTITTSGATKIATRAAAIQTRNM